MELALVLCLPRDAEPVQLTRDTGRFVDGAGVTAETRDDITLALGEACANVVQHADPADEYEMRVGVHHSRCWIEVIDAGCGFDAAMLEKMRADASVTAEHGRGLQIIDAPAENLQIANGPQHGAMVRFESRWRGSRAQPVNFRPGRLSPAPCHAN